MEEEKKKKKNKKKKTKQVKLTENVLVSTEEIAPMEQNHVADIEKNHNTRDAVLSEVDANLGQIYQAQSIGSTVALEEIWKLEAEKRSSLQREKHLEEGIKQVIEEKRSWILKEAILEEKIKDLKNETVACIQQENSDKEMIARLNGVNTSLMAHVKELEESKIGLIQENQHLVENISTLESRVQHLEREICLSASSVVKITKDDSEDEDPSKLIESACALVEKLVNENAELVEKVNELCIEVDRWKATVPHSSTAGSDLVMPNDTTQASFIPVSLQEYSEDSRASIQTIDETLNIVNEETTFTAEPGPGLAPEKSLELYQGGGNGEIVPVPLEESEVREVEPFMPQSGENDIVPLSDSPLIGAPFRLVSFVAKYVSGADLVEKSVSKVNSHR